VNRALDHFIETLARWTAYAGGLVLLAVVVMTCVSIAGRSLDRLATGFGPIPGDFELVEIGIGFAIFAFLPWCQLKRGHATVDLFQPYFGKQLNAFIELISDLLMFIAATLIGWRLWQGMLDKRGYTETTFILQFPVWIAYAAALVGAAVFVIVSLYCVWRSGRAFAGAS
jgi:TRAP-type C4-dicarboxylate transport system permease small subunit